MTKGRKANSPRRRAKVLALCLTPEFLLGSHPFSHLLTAATNGVFAGENLGTWALADWLEEQGDFGLAECLRDSLNTTTVVPLPESHRQSWRPVMGCQGGLFYCGGRKLLAPAIKAGRPGLGLVQTLDLQGCEIGAEELADVVECKGLTHLVRLNLRDTPLGNPGLTRIAQCERLHNLRDLSLWGCQAGPEGARHLASAASLGGLLRLNLRNNHLMLEGARAILESKRLSAINSLVMQRVFIDDGSLGSGPGWPGLRRLYLGTNRIGPESMLSLAVSNRLVDLEFLEVNGGRIRSLGAKAFVDAAKWPKLHTLEARDNRIGPGGARVLARLNLPALRLLDVRNNWLGEPGRALLKASPLAGRKVKLLLSKNEPRPRLPVGMRPIQAGNLIRRAWTRVRGIFGI